VTEFGVRDVEVSGFTNRVIQIDGKSGRDSGISFKNTNAEARIMIME
jgi:hypothetical protein